jgi:hypothetical protein
MTVREFNGTSDQIRLASGGMVGSTFGTFGAIFKCDDGATARTLYCFLTSSGTYVITPLQVDGSDDITWDGDAGIGGIPMGVWLTMIVRKATGSAAPRYSYYNHTTQAWVHANTASHANFTAIGGTDSIAMGTNHTPDEPFDGRLALMAGWNNDLHWTADAGGDAAIEAANLHKSVYYWITQGPEHLNTYDQADVTTAVADLVGSSSQIARTGTTVVNGDDPPGFSFSPLAPDMTGFLDLQNDDEYLLEDSSFVVLEAGAPSVFLPRSRFNRQRERVGRTATYST